MYITILCGACYLTFSIYNPINFGLKMGGISWEYMWVIGMLMGFIEIFAYFVFLFALTPQRLLDAVCILQSCRTVKMGYVSLDMGMDKSGKNDDSESKNDENSHHTDPKSKEECEMSPSIELDLSNDHE